MINPSSAGAQETGEHEDHGERELVEEDSDAVAGGGEECDYERFDNDDDDDDNIDDIDDDSESDDEMNGHQVWKKYLNLTKSFVRWRLCVSLLTCVIDI